MKKVLFALTLLFIATSCKKYADLPPQDPALGPIAKISLLPSKLSSVPAETQGDRNYNLLGYGYDVTGKFDDASSARVPVIDIIAFAREKHVEPSMSSSFSMNSWDGENAEDLALGLSRGTKATEGKKLYGQSIQSAFPGGQPFAEKYIYGFYSDIIQYKQLRFYVEKSVSNYLTPQFKSDLQTMNAETLVKKYGTHVLSDISLGARLNIVYQGETTVKNRASVQKAGYDIALKTIFGRFSGRINDIDSILLRQIKSPKVAFDVTGGDPSTIQVVETKNGQWVDLNAWTKHLSLKTSVFIRANNLIPLANLIDDPGRKAEVELYIESYLAANEVKLIK
jgi:hypothetical protein